MPQTDSASRSSAASEQAERALKERQRLYAQYKRKKHAHRRELYGTHPQLRGLALGLQRFGAADPVGLLRFIREENRSWLCTAPPEIRAEAASLVDERIIRIRGKAGLVPFDDPLPNLSGSGPTEDDDVWQLAKRELA